ncbi:MAG: hypothetical protein HY892_22735 [Deltaproteobacteria bacterium]|nr:hypothetical protein [Deltaproteobacteria bacterium]
MGAAVLGFGAFNTKKITGMDMVDFIKYRQLIDEGALMDGKALSETLAKPQAK